MTVSTAGFHTRHWTRWKTWFYWSVWGFTLLVYLQIYIIFQKSNFVQFLDANDVMRAVAGNANNVVTLGDSLWNNDGKVCGSEYKSVNLGNSSDNIWLMDCSSTETNASGIAETVAATIDGFGSTGNAIRKLLPSLDGSPKTIAFSVRMASLSDCNTLNSNDWRSDVILCIPLMNSDRTILSASMRWCGVPGLRVVTLNRPVSSGFSFSFVLVKCSTGGKVGNSSPCAGDNEVKKLGKLVSINSLVSAGDFEFDAGSIGIAADKDNVAATSR